ncbi:hypothetical protein CASFOL_038991 [Castilleja foliolosa]|uniref:RRM domain-containing protein n=1 Tax=Castilleja foliolosa TaxID=1961234 RepID=A0ABD3BJ61_9LAMI
MEPAPNMDQPSNCLSASAATTQSQTESPAIPPPSQSPATSADPPPAIPPPAQAPDISESISRLTDVEGRAILARAYKNHPGVRDLVHQATNTTEAEFREESLNVERRRVIVHNTPAGTRPADLEACFGIFGPIIDAQISLTQFHTVAFVLFAHPECAALAVQVPTANVNGADVQIHPGTDSCELCRPGQFEFYFNLIG